MSEGLSTVFTCEDLPYSVELLMFLEAQDVSENPTAVRTGVTTALGMRYEVTAQ